MKKSSYLGFVVIAILFVVIVVPNIVSHLSSIDGKSIEELTIKNRSGKPIYSFDGIPYNGRIYEYDSLSEVLLLEFSVLEGIFNGTYQEYYPDGSLLRSANYSNGVLNGMEEKYFNNGQLQESINYIQGNFNGKRMVYWTNGILKEQNSFKNGVLGGDNFYYFSDGKLRKSLKFDSNGKRNGLWEDFHPNGQLKLRVNYKNGDVLSKSDTFDFNGNIISNY